MELDLDSLVCKENGLIYGDLLRDHGQQKIEDFAKTYLAKFRSYPLSGEYNHVRDMYLQELSEIVTLDKRKMTLKEYYIYNPEELQILLLKLGQTRTQTEIFDKAVIAKTKALWMAGLLKEGG